MPSEVEVKGYKFWIDANGNTTYLNVADGVTIPVGYTASTNPNEDEVSEGLVIRDKQGNEYVWIEVPKEAYGEETLKIDPKKETFTDDECDQIYDDLRAYSDDPYNTKGTESAGDVYQDKIGFDDEKEYNKAKRKMSKSIYQNGGFWIGRYEAGIEGSTETDTNGTRKQAKPRTSENDTIENIKAVSQQNKYPYNFVTVSQAQTLSEAMKADGSNVTSSLMFGVQWNLVCRFIEKKLTESEGLLGENNIVEALNKDSRKWGNYNNSSFTIDRGEYTTSPNTTGSWKKFDNTADTENVNNKVKQNNKNVLLTTGASETNKVLNIYDFAGNEWEWTLEKATDAYFPCSSRGGYYGYYGNSNPASSRYNNYTSYSYDIVSFRVTLY